MRYTIENEFLKTKILLQDEQNAASKHGYKGCNQLENVTLVSVNSAGNEFDKTWIEETTVKEIMETPLGSTLISIIFNIIAQLLSKLLLFQKIALLLHVQFGM